MPLTLHIVPHTHWDREWHLPFQEFRMRLVRLLDRLLDLLDSDGPYRHFMLDGQSILLEDYLDIRPERAPEIAHFVRLGRLSIGPWYVLPDENLVAPESLVRNMMLGDRVCRRFGPKMRVGYVPDLFGHVSQLPQIMKGFGIDTIVLRRGLAEEPAELWWDAPDGSRALVCYLRDGYDNAARLPTSDPDAFVAAIQRARDSLAPHVLSGQVLLLAGTDHHEAQPELPGLIAYANKGHLGADRLVHSSLRAYVEAVREQSHHIELDVLAGDLAAPQRHHLLPGVLSARMWIKQRNDAIETLLTRWVEPFAAWAELVDAPERVARAPAASDSEHVHLTGHEPLRRVRRSAPLIWRAWRFLLENHPHDSICGCSIDQVHQEMVSRFDQAEQIGQEISRQSLATLAEQVDTRHLASSPDQPGPAQPVVVFNPIDGPRTDVVTARLRLPGGSGALEVVAPDGERVPHQVMAGGSGTERSLFRIDATAAELATYIRLAEGGRVLNHVIHHVGLRQTGDEVEVLLALSESGEPDQAHLSAVRARVEDLISAGAVSRFVLCAVIAETRALTFVAPDVPAYGYATYAVRSLQGTSSGSHAGTSDEDAPASNVLENDLLRVEADLTDGTLSVTDKTDGIVYSGLNRFVDGGDRGDTYNYCQPEEDHTIARPVTPPAVKIVEAGPARQTMEISQIYRLPRSLRPDRRGRTNQAQGGPDAFVDLPIRSRISIYPGLRRVDVETTVDNQARDHRLRVHFPVPANVDHAFTGAHYYVTRRPVPAILEDLDTEGWIEQPVPTVPQRGWAEVSKDRIGLLVANQGLPEVEFVSHDGQTTIVLTLLRCVGWLSRDDVHCRQGHAGPELPTPGAQCLGCHTFHYAIIPCADKNREQAHAQAEAFRVPLRAAAAGVHTGLLPPVASIVHVGPSAFKLTAIKQPEESSVPGLLVRGVNMSDQPVTVRLRPWREFDRVARVNLNEDFLEPLLSEPDGAIAIPARPWELVTVRWSEA